MASRTGIATVPLDWGQCPKWLFRLMKLLARSIMIVMREEFSQKEVLRRFADPVWFQSFGCVLGFDWNSSGLTTTALAAVKEGIRGLERDLDIYICGGKGQTSRKTPEQILRWGEVIGFSQEKTNSLVKASRMSAKVDTSCIQDGFQIYHHNFLFSSDGSWIVVQQGMNIEFQKARRYHWFSDQVVDFTVEPHSGIASQLKRPSLNLVHRQSQKNKNLISEIVKDSPLKSLIKDTEEILEKVRLMGERTKSLFSSLELPNSEFYWHPVVVENFDKKRLEKILFKIKEHSPQDFNEIVSLQGVGPKTIRALSLVAEIIYGAPPSFEDPARYTFAHGGKDGTPYFVDQKVYNETIEIFERAIKKSKLSFKEKSLARQRVQKVLK